MATPAAALKLMRSLCLALPDTTEGTHYGKVSFKVKRKIFATCGEERVGYGVIVALEPEHLRLVAASDPRFSPYREYPNCVFLAAADMNDHDEVRELVAESYGIVSGTTRAAERKPAKKRTVKKATKATSMKKTSVKKKTAEKKSPTTARAKRPGRKRAT